MLRIHSLYLYPVKSCAGIRVSHVWAGPQGLAGDRRWMVTDSTGAMLTARKHPELLRVQPLPDESGLWLTAPGMPSLHVERPVSGPVVSSQVWQDAVDKACLSEAGSEWFGRYLGQDVKLVWIPPENLRPVDPAWAGDAWTGFADGFPLLVTHQASLEDLARRVGMALDMRRFRPNVVIGGGEAWAEDGWSTLRAGEVTIALSKPCSRCVMTTLDPDTQARHPEVLRTLAGFRKTEAGVIFGRNALVRAPGMLCAGMSLREE
ncbi:MOSC N-terminal beta barrel domain-containing protein [Hahella sp. SMD15-11]|uniref:MOSC N-terminal beta barrel domain-containing protein n=1 Tax=Thermohahella caldifontis TaxID=3142973 RepID=A0AB39UXV4_9GAMM